MKSALSVTNDKRWLAVNLVSSLLLIAAGATAQSGELPKFMSHEVTIIPAKLDTETSQPLGPASVCIGGGPAPQCYRAPKDYGRDPAVEVVQLGNDSPALLFSAGSGGVSGWSVHFALLRPGTGKYLEDLLRDVTVSNQSQHTFWNEPALSDAPIFVTADFIWGPDEGHYDSHRYVISAYTLEDPEDLGSASYYLSDRYMTVRKYNQDANDDILGAEKAEILSRLRLVKAEADREQRPPKR